MFDMHGETVCYNEKDETAVIIDQTLLPGEIVTLELWEKEEMYDAIKRLAVRGAPAIGVFTAIGLSVLAARDKTADEKTLIEHFLENLEYLTSSRPTAVNLFAAADEMKRTAFLHKGEGADAVRAALKEKALELHGKDIEVCRKIGEYGTDLLKNCDSVLTHCNAGRLATVKYGTALAPVYVAAENGHKIRVFSDETRPLLQGARLTSFELANAGIDTTLICDNAASYVMKNGLVSAVLVGCDRVAANGDTANKIGTSGVAVLAKYYGIPFYVCAPFSTIDKNCLSGRDIKIEMRSGDEITDMWYEKRMAPKNIRTLNPAFDVTDNSLITAFITEKGVLSPNEF